jgi:hypothetical protein
MSTCKLLISCPYLTSLPVRLSLGRSACHSLILGFVCSGAWRIFGGIVISGDCDHLRSGARQRHHYKISSSPVGAGLGRSCKYVRPRKHQASPPPPRSPRDKYAALRNPHDKVDRLYAGHRSGALGRHLYGNGLPASLCPQSPKLRVNILLTNQLPHRGLGQTAKVKRSPFTKGVITVPRFGKECVHSAVKGWKRRHKRKPENADELATLCTYTSSPHASRESRLSMPAKTGKPKARGSKHFLPSTRGGFLGRNST